MLKKKDIIDIISKKIKLPPSKITNEISTENTPRWDSLAHFEIILELEKKTKKNIRTDQMSELNSVNKILESPFPCRKLMIHLV